MNDSTISLIRSIMKLAAGFIVANGYASGAEMETITAGLVAVALTVWGCLHRAKPAAPAAVPIKQIVPCLALLSLVLSPGCITAPGKPAGHIVAGTAGGKKLGITYNAITGLPELGVQSVDGEFAIIPLLLNTNTGNYYTPDFVMSREIMAKAGMFGTAAGTYTFATGSNAVQTLLGGMHYPVNAGFQTASNVSITLPAPLPK